MIVQFSILDPMLKTRKTTVEDAGLITQHRKAMFADMRDAAETVLDEMGRNFEPWCAA
jgi:hypothetical protein